MRELLGLTNLNGIGANPSQSVGWVTPLWPAGTSSRKLHLAGADGDSFWIAENDANNGYVGTRMRRADKLITGSIGGTSDVWRDGERFHIADAIVGRTDYTVAGTWTAVGANNLSASDSGYSTFSTWTPRSLPTRFTTVQNDYAICPIKTDANGKFCIAFARRENGSTNVVVTDADSGAVLNAGFSIKVAAAGNRDILNQEFTHPSGAGTYNIKVLKGDVGTGQLKIIAFNTVRQIEPTKLGPVDQSSMNFGSMLRSDNYYSNDHGENSFAAAELASGLLGGGIHGENLLQATQFLRDGITADLASYGYGSSLVFRQRTIIPWGSYGGAANGYLSRVLGFVTDGKPTEYVVPLSTPVFQYAYTAMFTAYITGDGATGMKQERLPNNIDVTAEGEYEFTPDGTKTVVSQNPVTKQTVRTTVSNAITGKIKTEYANTYAKQYLRGVVPGSPARLTSGWQRTSEFRFVDPVYT